MVVNTHPLEFSLAKSEKDDKDLDFAKKQMYRLIFCKSKYVKNIQDIPERQARLEVLANGGSMTSTKMANCPNFGRVWYNQDEKTNIGEADNVTLPIRDNKTSPDEDLFLSWHSKIGHAPFKNIQWTATQGIFPRKLADCRTIVCPAWLYGEQKRQPWQHKRKILQKQRIRRSVPVNLSRAISLSQELQDWLEN